MAAVMPFEAHETGRAGVSRSGEWDLDRSAYVYPSGGSGSELHCLVEDMHCGGCVRRIENALTALPGVENARADLTARRVKVVFDPERI